MCTVISELGRTARMYSELALRTEPTVSDVQLALIDAGTYWCVLARVYFLLIWYFYQ